MRPTYETEEDRRSEEAVIRYLAERRGLTWRKLPPKYPVDFALLKDELVMGWVEVKCRAIPHDKYPTYMLSLAKVMAMRQLADVSRLPAELVVLWTDSLGTLNMRNIAMRVAIGGRQDRDDEQDTEPVALIPIGQFSLT